MALDVLFIKNQSSPSGLESDFHGFNFDVENRGLMLWLYKQALKDNSHFSNSLFSAICPHC